MGHWLCEAGQARSLHQRSRVHALDYSGCVVMILLALIVLIIPLGLWSNKYFDNEHILRVFFCIAGSFSASFHSEGLFQNKLAV